MLLDSFKLLRANQPLLLAASTAFFTLFSLAPIIIIILNVLSLYFQKEEISDQLYNQIEAQFDNNTAEQIHNIVNNFRKQASSTWITIGGSIFLAFVSTTLFHVIRQAFNHIWNIRLKSKQNFAYTLKHRTQALLIIFVGGLLFVGSLFADTTVAVLKDYLDEIIPSVDAPLIRSISIVLSLIVVTLWFAILLKYLPDAQLKGKDAMIGGLFTAVLFNIGKYILGRFLITENFNDIFGTSASIMLLLLFIFYSSLIMYYGAAFTKVYIQTMSRNIIPKKNAELYTVSVARE
ncbi:YihY/virulence factor BrkB family protein [Fulvivirga sp. 29W222]|uniref:YihY/virulence factor BrkB family protein n=1 Tax=Fulvivirga marina TaxID=2494733 RepID=A0A937FWG3_9BACT|nr:YihY/virulence factor BrkB family protein [Fulvivirga marina]MBL6445596.1 YihY/virulence factor BrkB family protein [Fulvivirga marina]